MKKGRVPLQTIQRKTPAAPPAYRPMPVPKVLQRKTAVIVPNVNKPLPIPHVLQRKAITHPQTPPVSVKPNPLVQRMQPARPGISRPAIVQTKVVQRAAAPKWSFGHSEEDMSDKQWFKSGMATFCSIMVDEGGDALVELGLGKSLKTKTYGAEHAEDVAIRTLLSVYDAKALNGMMVLVNISKSPCSSTYGTSGAKHPGCTENLIAFKKKYKVNLMLTLRGVYKGVDGSHDALKLLRDNGILISTDERSGKEARYGEHKDDAMDEED
jgi:pyrimidine deaminase RibD-like protein